jgi:hypothetical protein
VHPLLLKNSADSTQLNSLGLDDCQPNSRCLTMIGAQQPSETLSTNHLTRLPANLRFGCDELVLKTLMIAHCKVHGCAGTERLCDRKRA